MIYADHAATTRLSQTAFEGAKEFLLEEYGNASSRYSMGTRAKRALETARERVAALIGAEPCEIFFTSGGSEGNSWTLAAMNERPRASLVVSAFEHPSVHQNALVFQRKGGDVVFLPIERSGIVELGACEAILREKQVGLISVMSVNNEVGTAQPIKKIVELARGKNALVHTDAVQAMGKMKLDVKELGVDILTASAHKFNGPKGVGFLYKRNGVELPSHIRGGGQERGERSGTENVFGAVAASLALEENIARLDETKKLIQELFSKTLEAIYAEVEPGDVQIAGDAAVRLPGTFDLLFKNADGEALSIIADMKGVCVSTGSACDSVKKEPSRILLAMGYTREEASSAIRVSYGAENTLEEAEKVGKTLAFAYKKIRRN